MTPKPGSRAVGIAASDGPEWSQLCGAVVRADRGAEDFVFTRCTTGGSDATAACRRTLDRLDRPDARWVLLAGIAPAWFNIIDLDAIADTADRPVIAVAFEASEGLESALEAHFSGNALERRLDTYRALPPRERVTVGGSDLWVRTVGIEAAAAADVLRAFSADEQKRPEPLRVAKAAARAGRQQAERFGWAGDPAGESDDS